MGCLPPDDFTDVDCDRTAVAITKSFHARYFLYGFVAWAAHKLLTPQVPGPYRAAAKAWVQRAYPRSSTWSSDGVGSV